MRFRRTPERLLNRAFAPLVMGQFLAYKEGVALCYEVAAADEIDDDLRRRALDLACHIAFVSRGIWESMLNLNMLDQIPLEHNPQPALAASARLVYSLTATAEPEPEPQTILTIGELDGLPVQFALGEWLESLEEKPEKDRGAR